MFQVVQNSPGHLELHDCAKNIGSETQTSLGDKAPGLSEPKRNTKAKSWPWLDLQGQEVTVEMREWPQAQKTPVMLRP